MILWKMIRNALSTLMLLISLCLICLRVAPLVLGTSLGGGGSPSLGPPGVATVPRGFDPQNMVGMSQEDLLRTLMALRQQFGQPGSPMTMPGEPTGPASTRLPQIRTGFPQGTTGVRGHKLVRVGE